MRAPEPANPVDVASSTPPTTPSASTVLFEGEPTPTGYRLRAVRFNSELGGVSVALLRRTLQMPGAGGEHTVAWYIVSELAVYPPISIAEMLRTYVAWLNSYDANLKDALGPLQEVLGKIKDVAPPAGAAGNRLN